MIGERELTVPAEIDAEIEEFERRAQAFRAGEESEDDFKPYRLSYGIYGQRQEGFQMVRVKVPHGRLTADQLDALAEFSERFCEEGEYPGGGGRGMGHVTTRQDFQFHFVRLARVPEAMRHLARAGLTTREACYNTVRNITGCPLAGACGTEAFDITPYAQAATELFLRNPICQNLPRKFKIAFSGCASDCALGAMHDIGAVAQVRDGERGFRVWVGGGLGNSPRPATLLYDFVPVRRFFQVIEAIIRIFDGEGPRKNRNRARIKFMFDKTYTAEVVPDPGRGGGCRASRGRLVPPNPHRIAGAGGARAGAPRDGDLDAGHRPERGRPRGPLRPLAGHQRHAPQARGVWSGDHPPASR